MRVIQSFERRLQGAVGNTFARLFGGTVQPAEVADALQRVGDLSGLYRSAEQPREGVPDGALQASFEALDDAHRHLLPPLGLPRAGHDRVRAGVRARAIDTPSTVDRSGDASRWCRLLDVAGRCSSV